MPWLPIRAAAAALGVAPDTIRRRLRRGTLVGRQDAGPPRRWLVEVPMPAASGPPPDAGAPTRQEFEQTIAALEAANQALRGQLATVHDTLAHERGEAAKVSAALEQFSRALPAPPSEPPRRRWRWPW